MATDQERKGQLQSSVTVVSICDRYEVSIEGPDEDGVFTLCVASEDGDQHVWLGRDALTKIERWIDE